MAINKKLIHFNTFENFNSKKLSANTENTQYTIGINGSIQTGSPDILYQSIVYIKDTKQQWTHGQLYSGSNINLSEYATKEELNDKQDTITDLETIRQGAAKGATSIQQGTLSTVAASGSYNDLSDKPSIPSAITESTVSGWGFTKNTGTYSKPSGGIPKSDLASAVQTSLGKADTALQSYTEQYKGTVTGVKINGTTKNPSNGVVDLGTVITSHQDISGKQNTLVSGTNIKTINGESILGEGDLTVTTEANVQAVDTGDIVDDVNVEYTTKTYVDGLVGDINSVLESIINS